MGLGLDQGLLEQAPIADGPGAAAITAPISGEGLDPPAELMGGAADGAISATGPAMQQQMNSPPARALEQGGGDALLGLDEITSTGRDDDGRAMGSWPLAQLLSYQYKCTERPVDWLRGNGSTQSKAMR